MRTDPNTDDLEDLVRATRQVVLLLDADGTVVASNRAYKPPGTPLARWAPPTERARLELATRAAVHDGRFTEYLSVDRAAGPELVRSVVVRPLERASGRVAAYTATLVPAPGMGPGSGARAQLESEPLDGHHWMRGFVHGVVHEVNNGLFVISSSLQLALAAHPEAPDPELLDEAVRGCHRTAAAMDELLRLPEKVGFGAGECAAHSVLTRLLGQAPAHLGATVAVHGDLRATRDGIPITAAKLEQLWFILLCNARAALDGRGALTIATRDEDGPDGAPWFVLEARDTGRGMPAHVVARVFEPFFTTRKADHMGLGLTIVQVLVALSGGRVDISSAPGEGTVVRLAWPVLDHEPAVTTLTPEPYDGDGASLDVVLVADDPQLAGLTEALVLLLGHGCRVVGDAAALQAQLGVGGVDVVIVDEDLQGAGALEAASTVRATAPGVRTILLTGGNCPVEAESLPAYVERLAKPFVLEVLARALASVAEEP